MKTLFFGSGSFPLPMFQKLSKISCLNPQLTLVTVPNHSYKEKNLIKDYANKQKFQIYQPNLADKSVKFSDQIHDQPDIGIVCNYGFMIPSDVIDIFRKGVYVIHPSLLPKYRGAAPIQRALMNNEVETGVSYIEISKNKFDAGAILYQQKINIEFNDRYQELSSKLSILCENSIEEFILNLDNFPRIQQLQEQTTKAPKLKEQHQHIDFQKNVQEIYNQYRGIYGTNFHSIKFKFQDKEFFIESASLICDEEQRLLEQYKQGSCGTLWILKNKPYKNFVYIKFQSDQWMRIEKFRFCDRGLIQAAYTFKDQYMKEFKHNSLQNQYLIS